MKKQLIALTAVFAVAFTMTARAASTGELPGVAVQPASHFYTGKPYDADLDAYVFNYRNYDVELNRWTTIDPVGYPDGANPHRYGCRPLTDVDPLGQFAISITDTEAYDSLYFTDAFDDDHTITPFAPIGLPAGLSPSNQNLLQAAYSAATIINGGTLAGEVLVDIMHAGIYDSGTKGGASIGAAYNNYVPSSSYSWAQFVTWSEGGRKADPYLDGGAFYPDSVLDGRYLRDTPSRFFPDVSSDFREIAWRADAYLCLFDSVANIITVYDGLTWGFDIYE